MDDADPRRPPRLEPRVELLGHPVGERADLVDMGDHRRAPADFEPALLRRRQPSPAEQQQFAPVRPVNLQKPLGDVEHPPVERAGEALLGAERNDEMSVAPVARAARTAASSARASAWPIAAPTVAA